eukprot:4990645-Prymnesium_polylepis.1
MPRPTLPHPLPPASPRSVHRTLILSGLCDNLASYDGTYMLQGITANGAPYYANENSRTLYFDTNCAGSGNRTPRWIIDNSVLDPARMSDLDSDGTCAYAADFTASQLDPPLGVRSWDAFCGTWTIVDVTLTAVPPPPPSPPAVPPMPPSTPPFSYPQIELSGLFCPQHTTSLGTYNLQGTT